MPKPDREDFYGRDPGNDGHILYDNFIDASRAFDALEKSAMILYGSEYEKIAPVYQIMIVRHGVSASIPNILRHRSVSERYKIVERKEQK